MNKQELLDAAFDFSLTPVEFKVFYFLVKEARENLTVCESLESIAKNCKIGRTTVIRALESLAEKRIINKLKLDGISSTYFLNSPDLWVSEKGDTSTKTELPTSTDLVLPTSTDLVLPQEQRVSTEPLKGVPVDPVVAPESASSTKTELPTSTKTELPEENLTFGEKIEKARFELGLNVGIGYTETKELVVTVEGNRMSQQEFMQRSLTGMSWEAKPASIEDRKCCHDVIERIKARQKGFRDRP